MKHIIVDLEMNMLAKEHRDKRLICSMEVIEIGAVVLDEQYTEIGSFKTLVKPEFNHIVDKKCSKITGITTEMLANAPSFQDALHMFLSWCHSMNDEIQLYQWSENDHYQIIKEMLMKGITMPYHFQPYLNIWYDFQKEFGEKMTLTRSISLKNAIMYAGLEFEGQEHDALWDARNTSTLLRIVRNPQLCKETLDHVIAFLTPAPLSTSLGDLFDFSGLFEATA